MQYPALSIQPPNIAHAYMQGMQVRAAQTSNELLQRKLKRENELTGLRQKIFAGQGGESSSESLGSEEADAALREYAAHDPAGAKQIIDALDSMDARKLAETRKKNALSGKLAMQVLEAPPQQRPMIYAQIREHAKQQGLNVDSLPPQYDENKIQLSLMRALGIDKYTEYLDKRRLSKSDMVKVMTSKGPVWKKADEARGQPAEPSSSLVTLDMGNKVDKEILGLDVADIKAAQERVQSQEDLQPRLEVIVRGLESGKVDTDRVQNALLPVRQFANALGWTDDPNLSQAENVFAAMKFMAPRMRVTGSGSTSDKEMKAFAQAAPEFGYTTEANILLGRSMMQVQRYNKKRVELMKRYLRANKSLDGFGEWADKEQGRIFPVASNPSEYGAIPAGSVYYHAEAKEFRVRGKK